MQHSIPEATAPNRGEITATLSGLMLGVLMAAMDNTVVGTAMPRVIRDLQGLDLYSWPFTAYLLASTLAIPVFGRLADQVGRRIVFLAGLVEFIIASVLCGMSPNMPAFIVFRGLQGLGGGILVSNAFALAGEISRPEKRGAYMGLIGSMFGISGLLGPSVGGLLSDGPGWRWAFYINLPLGIVALLVLVFGLRHVREERGRPELDPLGIALFALTVTPLMLALSWAGRDYPWTSPVILGLFAAFAVFALLFLAVERRSKHALLPAWLFTKRDFNMAALGTALSNAAFFGAILFLPLWMQEVLGVSASTSGLAVTPMLLAYTLSSVFGGQLIGRLRSVRLYAIVAGLVAIAGSILLVQVDRSMGQLPVILAMVVLGVGLGANTPTLTMAAQNAVEPRFIGLATATNSFFRNLGSAIGSAVMGSVFIRGLGKGLARIDWGQAPEGLRATLQDPKVLMSPAALHAIGDKVPLAFRPALDRIMDQIGSSLALGISGVFVVMAVAAILGLLPLIFLRGGRRT